MENTPKTEFTTTNSDPLIDIGLFLTKLIHLNRWQLPLEPAYAITTHKMQGATAKFGAVIEPSQTKPFARGLDYVAASRPTELKKLFLLGPLTHNQFNAFPSERNDITLEYDRLRNVHNP